MAYGSLDVLVTADISTFEERMDEVDRRLSKVGNVDVDIAELKRQFNEINKLAATLKPILLEAEYKTKNAAAAKKVADDIAGANEKAAQSAKKAAEAQAVFEKRVESMRAALSVRFGHSSNLDDISNSLGGISSENINQAELAVKRLVNAQKEESAELKTMAQAIKQTNAEQEKLNAAINARKTAFQSKVSRNAEFSSAGIKSEEDSLFQHLRYQIKELESLKKSFQNKAAQNSKLSVASQKADEDNLFQHLRHQINELESRQKDFRNKVSQNTKISVAKQKADEDDLFRHLRYRMNEVAAVQKSFQSKMAQNAKASVASRKADEDDLFRDLRYQMEQREQAAKAYNQSLLSEQKAFYNKREQMDRAHEEASRMNVQRNRLMQRVGTPHSSLAGFEKAGLLSGVEVDNIRAVEAALRKARQSDEQFNKAMQQSIALQNKFIERGGKMGTVVAGRLGQASQAAEKTRDSLQKTNATLSSLINTVRRWLIGYLAVSGIIQLFGRLKEAVIDYNAILDKAVLSFTSKLHGNREMAQGLIKDLERLAAQTPFEFKDLLPLSQKLLDAGRNAKSLVGDMSSIGDFVARIGEGKEFIDRIVYALNQVSTAGKVAGTEIRQLTEARVPAIKILADAWGVNTAQMQKWVHDGIVPADLAVEALIEGMGNIGSGFMIKQMRTFEGAMSNLHDTFDRITSRALRPLYDELTRVLNATNDFFASGAGDAWSDKFAGNVQDVMDKLKALYSTLNDLKGLFIALGFIWASTKIVPLIVGVVNGLTALVEVLSAMKIAASVAGGWAALETAFASLGVAIAAWPIALAVLAVALIAGTGLWVKYNRELERTQIISKVTTEGIKETAEAFSVIEQVAGKNQKAIKYFAELRQKVEAAQGDSKKLKEALRDLADAQYRIKNLDLDPLALSVANSEIDRLQAKLDRLAGRIPVQGAQDWFMNELGPEAQRAENYHEKKLRLIQEARRRMDEANAIQERANSINPMRLGPSDEVAARIGRILGSAPADDGKHINERASYLKKFYKQYEEFSARMIAAGKSWTESEAKAIGELASAYNATLPDVQKKYTEAQLKQADNTAKAAAAAKKRLEDQLRDSAAFYDKLAKASEDSADRQIKALQSVSDKLRGVFSSAQEELLKLGITNNPLGKLIESFMGKTGLEGAMNKIAQRAMGIAAGYRSTATGYQQRLEQSQGLDGSVPQRGGAAAAIAQSAVRMQDFAAKYQGQCDRLADITVNTATKIFNGIMGPRKGDTAAKTMRRFQNAGIGFAANGSYAAGDILYSGKSAGGAGHAMVVGPDGRYYDQHGARSTPLVKPEWVVRPSGSGGPMSPAGGASADITGAKDLLAQLADVRHELKNAQYTEVPKAWGAAVRNTESTTYRFMAQMLLANKGFQDFMRNLKGDKFDSFVSDLRSTTNELDGMVAAQRELLKIDEERAKRFKSGQLMAEYLSNARRTMLYDSGDWKRDLWNQFKVGGEFYSGDAGKDGARYYTELKRQTDQRIHEARKVGNELVKVAKETTQELLADNKERQRLFEMANKFASQMDEQPLNEKQAASFEEQRNALLKAGQIAELLKNANVLSEAGDWKRAFEMRAEAMKRFRLEADLLWQSVQRDVKSGAWDEYQKKVQGIAVAFKDAMVNAKKLVAEQFALADTVYRLLNKKELTLSHANDVARLWSENGVPDQRTILQKLGLGERGIGGNDLMSMLGIPDSEAYAISQKEQNLGRLRSLELQGQSASLENLGLLTDLQRQLLEFQGEDLWQKDHFIRLTDEQRVSVEQYRESIVNLIRTNQELAQQNAMNGLSDRLAYTQQFGAKFDPYGKNPTSERYMRQKELERMYAAASAMEDGQAQNDAIKAWQDARDRFDIEGLISDAERSAAAIQNVYQQLGQGIISAMDTALQTSGNAFDRIEAFAGAMVDNVADMLLKMAQQIIANYILMQITGLVTGIAGATTPNLKTGQYGGVQQAASGMDKIPYDGMIAMLHKNETVLNAQAAEAWRQSQKNNSEVSASRYSVPQQQSVVINVTHNGPINAGSDSEYAREAHNAVKNNTSYDSRRTVSRAISDVNSYGSVSR